MSECVIADCPIEGVVPIALGDEPPDGFPLRLPVPPPPFGAVCSTHAALVTHWLAARAWRHRVFCGYL